jgi:hypothetical protein
MGLSSPTLRNTLFLLAAVAVAGVTLAIVHRGEGHNVAAAPVVEQQPVAATESQPQPLPQPTKTLPEVEPPKISSEDESAFASFAEADVSQLREGVTLAQWMDLHKNEGWGTSTDEAYFDCRTMVKTEVLPSGRQIT